MNHLEKIFEDYSCFVGVREEFGDLSAEDAHTLYTRASELMQSKEISFEELQEMEDQVFDGRTLPRIDPTQFSSDQTPFLEVFPVDVSRAISGFYQHSGEPSVATAASSMSDLTTICGFSPNP